MSVLEYSFLSIVRCKFLPGGRLWEVKNDSAFYRFSLPFDQRFLSGMAYSVYEVVRVACLPRNCHSIYATDIGL